MASSSWDDLLDKAGNSDVGEDLTPGTYEVEVEKAEYTVASTGRDMWKQTFVVVSGPSKGGKAWNNLVLVPENENALAVFFRNMKAMGIGRDFFTNLPSDKRKANDAIADAMVGQRCKITLARRGGTGEYADRMDVKKMEPPSGGQPEVTTPPTTSSGGPKVSF